MPNDDIGFRHNDFFVIFMVFLSGIAEADLYFRIYLMFIGRPRVELKYFWSATLPKSVHDRCEIKKESRNDKALVDSVFLVISQLFWLDGSHGQ
jgi:hypothetical protein